MYQECGGRIAVTGETVPTKPCQLLGDTDSPMSHYDAPTVEAVGPTFPGR